MSNYSRMLLALMLLTIHSESSAFSGEIAGEEAQLPSPVHRVFVNAVDTKTGPSTYARVFKTESLRDLRAQIVVAGDRDDGRGYVACGLQYRRDGGFFLEQNVLSSIQSKLNCFGYALGWYGDKLALRVGKPMAQIQKDVDQSIDAYAGEYFECVDTPQDGDLVLYYNDQPRWTPDGSKVERGITHAGIFHTNRRVPGGVVESKWGWFGVDQPYIHDIFFKSSYSGDTVLFYRLKS